MWFISSWGNSLSLDQSCPIPAEQAGIIPLCRLPSLVAQTVKRLPTMQKTRVQSLGREDPLEKETAPHSSTLAWKIPWTEEPDRLQSAKSAAKLLQSCPTLSDPHGLQSTRLLRPWDFPGKSTGVGCRFLLQRIFPTQG